MGCNASKEGTKEPAKPAKNQQTPTKAKRGAAPVVISSATKSQVDMGWIKIPDSVSPDLIYAGIALLEERFADVTELDQFSD
jgi:hypothetical protein